MIRFISTIAALLVFGFAFSATADAQSPPVQKVTVYDKVPDEYLEEAERFHQYCAGTASMNLYYNCECMAVKYLDQRIAGGPALTQNSIVLSLQGECRDATQAAGAEYQQCHERASLLSEGTDVEKYCTCVGNTYAKLFQNSKVAANSSNFVDLKAKAQLLCEDPALAREVYPDLIVP